MSVATMMMQLGKGMIATAEIFFLTLLFLFLWGFWYPLEGCPKIP